jgi:hypothetical protein
MARIPGKCMHIMVDGANCGSPAMRGARLCSHHKRQHEQANTVKAERARDSRKPQFAFPVLEDSNSIHVSLTKIMQLLAAGQIDRKTAGLMLYSLQIATSNLQYAELEKSP